MDQAQLKSYKAQLEEIFFSRKYSGDVATLIKKDIIRVSKLITPEKIVLVQDHINQIVAETKSKMVNN